MKILYLLLVFLLLGCGYKPSSLYTKKVLGKNIHVDATISRSDPKNSVLIKDAVNEAVVSRFGANLSDKKSADTNLVVSIGSVSFSPTVYNEDGYVIAYKAKVTLNSSFKDDSGVVKNFSTVGEFNFPIEANSVISDTKRFEAIKNASYDAINEIVSKISIMGIMNGKKRSRVKRDIKVYLE